MWQGAKLNLLISGTFTSGVNNVMTRRDRSKRHPISSSQMERAVNRRAGTKSCQNVCKSSVPRSMHGIEIFSRKVRKSRNIFRAHLVVQICSEPLMIVLIPFLFFPRLVSSSQCTFKNLSSKPSHETSFPSLFSNLMPNFEVHHSFLDAN